MRLIEIADRKCEIDANNMLVVHLNDHLLEEAAVTIHKLHQQVEGEQF